jgi:hypothetical protein
MPSRAFQSVFAEASNPEASSREFDSAASSETSIHAVEMKER